MVEVEIIIKAEPKEIAALAVTIQERQNKRYSDQELISQVMYAISFAFVPVTSCDNA